MIQINEIYKSFKDLEVLKGISFDVHEGEIVTVIGPSGSGKSTLLRCINHLEEPQSGSICFDGEEFRYGSMDKKEIWRLRQKSSMVFQNYNLFQHRTVLENITDPLIHVQAWINRKPSKQPWRCWKRSAFQKKRRLIPVSFPAASSSGWESPGLWR